MDWLKSMNRVVCYIEDNLTEPIQHEILARMVGCSVHEFSRIFSFMTGISLSEYVRRRRLTCAALDIKRGNAKIIEIAMAYCYDSPAAFTRAFVALHGCTPMAARKSDAALKHFAPLKFVLSIKGVNEMNFRIMDRPAFNVVGIKHIFRLTEENDWDVFNEVPKLWAKTSAEQLAQLKSLAKDGATEVYGMYTRNYLGTVEYLIATISDADPPEGFVKHHVKACRWLVVENAADDNNISERVFTEWMPSSDYRRAQTSFPAMECYINKDPDGTNLSQLWVPVDSEADVTRKFAAAKAELERVEKEAANKTPVEIDLQTMIPNEGAVRDGLQVSYTPDGKLVAFCPTSGNGLIATERHFTAPIKIQMRAKTDSTNLRLYYGGREGGGIRSDADLQNHIWGAWMHLNGAGNDGDFYGDEWTGGEDSLWISDLAVMNEHYYKGATRIPSNEYVDVEWILAKTVMAVRVNGELRVATLENEYIDAFKQGFSVTGPVHPAPGRGSTITVERLLVTEL
ncbi:MAG: AraC family transcriptional regulator [Defluviitaleaceae bacterium]|nr:AraC family transcriptional regulator [Defluviitaleaceae bacterium]